MQVPARWREGVSAAARLANAGMLRLYLLRIGNSPAAAYYGFTAKGRAYAYLSGFDPDWAELCPGAQIIQTVLKRGIRRRWQYQSANEMGC